MVKKICLLKMKMEVLYRYNEIWNKIKKTLNKVSLFMMTNT